MMDDKTQKPKTIWSKLTDILLVSGLTVALNAAGVDCQNAGVIAKTVVNAVTVTTQQTP